MMTSEHAIRAFEEAKRAERAEVQRLKDIRDTPLYKKISIADYLFMIFGPLFLTGWCFFYLHNTLAGAVAAYATILSMLMVLQGIMVRESKELTTIALSQRDDAMTLSLHLTQLTEKRLAHALREAFKGQQATVTVLNDENTTKH